MASKVAGIVLLPASPLQHVTDALKRRIRLSPVTGLVEHTKTSGPVLAGSGNELSLQRKKDRR